MCEWRLVRPGRREPVSEVGDMTAMISDFSPAAREKGRPVGHPEVLTACETRVLHYLPTNLSAREIAGELHLSVNTVKTHQRHLYQKLGACGRTQAVAQARALGLLAPYALMR
jgi:LuxR family transcriptional regulator, maltose regulon positive regulatory protein